DGLMAYSNNNWSAININVTPELQGKELWDFLDVAVHPETRKVYGAALIEGLLEWDGENFTIYDDSNSSLNNAVGDDTRTRVSNLDFDAQNNLWMTNHLATRPISVLKNDGDWQSFALPSACSGQTQLEQVLVDENNYKWFVTGSNSGGLLVYDTGDNLESVSDDRCRLFTSSNSELPSNIVNTISMDRDGELWVGTSQGVVVFQAFDPFDANADFYAPRTDQNATNKGLLLSTEDVNCIAIDGADRKWFGTTNGVFVTSSDGTVQEARFTTENSPLFDDTILDIAIDPNSGEVFIGTASGLISYKGKAIAANQVNRSDAYAYPNPVRPDYEGPIAIKGLAEDANVKITDANGQLIYETTAFGGQAIWDGTDYNGRRASTGVYLVFSTNKNIFVPDAAVAKILFVH
ncbi:MAG: two-component regulator propeller domain-containing protein, partial [Bacteroidota bacterium]